MKCPKCQFEQDDQNAECMRCGIIFEKYRKHLNSKTALNASFLGSKEKAARKSKFVKDILFYIEPDTNTLIFGFRSLFLLCIFIWGLKFIFTPMQSNYTGESLWHLVNLPFHEAGHIIFRPFGRFATALGGSLGQLLMPLVCLIVFLIKTRDPFAASFSLWWLGENFMDLAPYINDAGELVLPLLGGNTGQTSPYGFHDWEFILRESGLIRYNHFLANLSYKLGAVLMIVAFIWGGYILFKQYRNIKLKK